MRCRVNKCVRETSPVKAVSGHALLMVSVTRALSSEEYRLDAVSKVMLFVEQSPEPCVDNVGVAWRDGSMSSSCH
jgi:hypothetical protein